MHSLCSVLCIFLWAKLDSDLFEHNHQIAHCEKGWHQLEINNKFFFTKDKVQMALGSLRKQQLANVAIIKTRHNGSTQAFSIEAGFQMERYSKAPHSPATPSHNKLQPFRLSIQHWLKSGCRYRFLLTQRKPEESDGWGSKISIPLPVSCIFHENVSHILATDFSSNIPKKYMIPTKFFVK